MNSGLMPLGGPSLAPLPSAPAPLPRRPAPPRSRTPTSTPTPTPTPTPTATRAPVRTALPMRRSESRGLAGCTLALVFALEVLLLSAPQALLLHPWQAVHAAKVASGYAMLALLAFAMAFGWLRRLPALAQGQRRLNALHQAAGLLLLLLLALHSASRPGGFLLLAFHAMALGQGAGALRAVLGARAGRQGGNALLVLHIGLACLVAGAALVHVWFVLSYTA